MQKGAQICIIEAVRAVRIKNVGEKVSMPYLLINHSDCFEWAEVILLIVQLLEIGISNDKIFELGK